MGDASGYAAVLRSIEDDVGSLMKTHPGIFEFTDITDGMLSVRDFGTTGVVTTTRVSDRPTHPRQEGYSWSPCDD